MKLIPTTDGSQRHHVGTLPDGQRPHRSGGSPHTEDAVGGLLGPLTGGFVVMLLTISTGSRSLLPFFAFLAAIAGIATLRDSARAAALLPFMRLAYVAAAPLAGITAVALVRFFPGQPSFGPVALAGVFVASLAAALAPRLLEGPSWVAARRTRVAVIGLDRSAESLRRELALAGNDDYMVVGHVVAPDDQHAPKVGSTPLLGTLDELGDIVARHDIRLLIHTDEVPRLQIFHEVAHSCLHTPVRLWHLSGFYEEVFGHVPLAEINASWFQYFMHPRYRTAESPWKRVLDLVLASSIGLVSLPLLLALGLLIRRDGGPALFKQPRVGERGEPFTLFKLRTMRVDAAAAAQWASLDDPRITRIGHFLRKSHLDELPQLWNVIRGEMSLVGPRPEQPEFVDRLERSVPFYQRRHMVRPGITGWAQVRCGYAGSDVGSAWKLCHDLYYLKHRSMVFDVVILGETFRTLFSDRRHAIEPRHTSFILPGADLPADHAPIPALRSSA